MTSNLIKRLCPLCGSENFDEIITLKENNIITSNPSYRIERISELGLDSDQLYPIVKCRLCEMIYSLYHLDDKREKIVYERIIDTEISKMKVLTLGRRIADGRKWLKLLSLIDDSKQETVNLKVIDFGCGWGNLLLVAKGPGVLAIGFDVTSWKVAWAREQGITICESEKELMGYAPFDIGIMTSVLEHLREPKKAIDTFTSLLKPGGYCLITCIIHFAAHPFSWKELKKKVLRGLPIPKEINPWEHLNYFTPETLIKFLTSFGFVPIDSTVRWITKDGKDRQSERNLLRKYWPWRQWLYIKIPIYWKFKGL